MEKLYCILTSILVTSFSFSQSIITGRTKDNKGRPVPGVSITIKDSYDGGTSDSTGKYKFRTSEQGDKIIIATSMGYRSSEQKIILNGTSVNLDFNLKEEPNELKAVVITAGSFEASDSKRTTVLNPIDIVTTDRKSTRLNSSH